MNDAWFAYQLDLPDEGEGIVVVVKRPLSNFTRAAFPLQALLAGGRLRSHQSRYRRNSKF